MGYKNWREQEVERLGRRHIARLLGYLERQMGGAVHRVVRRAIMNSYAMMVEDVVDNVLRKRGSPCRGRDSMDGRREE